MGARTENSVGKVGRGPEDLHRHPKGLYALFFTEMWERMGYYGMRALLVLFMVDTQARGGLGLDVERAAAIYGLFTAGAYLAALPGGWVGDRLLGARWSVGFGGFLIAVGYLLLAVPGNGFFYIALLVVVLGTGLLKPNITAMVGGLYADAVHRRDAGFTIFYMGINIGAAIGPIICSTVAQAYGWRAGFGVAGLGMLMGLVQYGLTNRFLGAVGCRSVTSMSGGGAGQIPVSGSCQKPVLKETLARHDCSWRGRLLVAAGLVALGCLSVVIGSGLIRIDPVTAAKSAATVITIIGGAYFLSAIFLMGLTGQERRRVFAILVLFLASAVFWAGFEQAGSSFNLFAQNHTQRVLSLPRIGGLVPETFEIPAGWFQSLGAIFVIVLAPVMATLWTVLEERGIHLQASAKFGVGLFLLSLGFAVMVVASVYAARGELLSPFWLVVTYFLHAIGELCVSPVGLSSVTRLAPAKLVGQMVGIWFLATSLGNLLAGLIAGRVGAGTGMPMPYVYLGVGLAAFCLGALLFAITRPLSRLTEKATHYQ